MTRHLSILAFDLALLAFYAGFAAGLWLATGLARARRAATAPLAAPPPDATGSTAPGGTDVGLILFADWERGYRPLRPEEMN